jgi:ubiquitin-protein ligase
MCKRILKELYNITSIKTPDIYQYKIKIHNFKSLYDIDFSFLEAESSRSFYINFTFTEQYPFKKPKIKFILDGVFIHPNVYPNGRICMRTLDMWSPGNTIVQIIKDICKILVEPDPKYSCNPETF